MNWKPAALIFGLVAFGLALSCFGDPPTFGQTEESVQIDQLRREVDELKTTVSVLRARLWDLEYQGISQSLRVLPDGQLAERDGQRSEAAPDGYLRFPYDIERANALPPWRNIPDSNR